MCSCCYLGSARDRAKRWHNIRIRHESSTGNNGSGDMSNPHQATDAEELLSGTITGSCLENDVRRHKIASRDEHRICNLHDWQTATYSETYRTRKCPRAPLVPQRPEGERVRPQLSRAPQIRSQRKIESSPITIRNNNNSNRVEEVEEDDEIVCEPVGVRVDSMADLIVTPYHEDHNTCIEQDQPIKSRGQHQVQPSQSDLQAHTTDTHVTTKSAYAPASASEMQPASDTPAANSSSKVQHDVMEGLRVRRYVALMCCLCIVCV